MNEKPEPSWAFKLMSVIHDNPLRRKFSNPYSTLISAGLKPGQRVLEIGPGPGFFTIPAARIVKETGTVYAIDIHPLAIEKISERMQKEQITNVKVYLADARNTGLPTDSIDLAFLFGVIHNLDAKFQELLKELDRVLVRNGIIAIQRFRCARDELISVMKDHGFSYYRSKKRLFLFTNAN